ncbi:hypothetical protein [Polyangium aurulentum]|uniref:hypothetical protein n=1 Tax=Polyangium aurulentum TaxID=2567896 RepID=UPI00146F3707|nr:hypothetical protein [Polyangium aurulentum]UQA63265.1 hypothetical protein E8A73_023480 [Polyangium aurulentum]
MLVHRSADRDHPCRIAHRILRALRRHNPYARAQEGGRHELDERLSEHSPRSRVPLRIPQIALDALHDRWWQKRLHEPRQGRSPRLHALERESQHEHVIGVVARTDQEDGLRDRQRSGAVLNLRGCRRYRRCR